jgi:hypothetical protein
MNRTDGDSSMCAFDAALGEGVDEVTKPLRDLGGSTTSVGGGHAGSGRRLDSADAELLGRAGGRLLRRLQACQRRAERGGRTRETAQRR